MDDDLLKKLAVLRDGEGERNPSDALLLAEALKQLAQENEAMYEEIQELNNDLEKKIEDRTNELSLANDKLEKLSKLDPLTELPNRRFFDKKLQEEWNQSLQKKQPISILMIDIDFFKGYNDHYGHIQGDECLIAVAHNLKSQLNDKNQFVARFGGEEFVVLLSNTDRSMAFIIAEKLRTTIEHLNLPHECSEISNIVTISIGFNSIIASDDDTISDFINQADQALYMAKETSRTCVLMYDS